MSFSEQGFVLWFTGLSGSGKSELAKRVAEKLRKVRKYVEVLDGDVVRQSLTKDLGFTEADRKTNLERVTFVAQLLSRNGVATIISFISPYIASRWAARQTTTNFIEVFVKCPVEVCMERDVKGLYRKAIAGEIRNFTGISHPYEDPPKPEILVETDKETPEESTAKIWNYLVNNGYIPDGSR
ncbi:MAG: adenylyl-sulfate kinase [Candidatus Heimdallarchaeota archaeon]